jgi:hypothetical protein
MRGNVYRLGRRRTGSILPAAAVALVMALALVLGSAATALANAPAPRGRSVVVIAVTHSPGLRTAPTPVAHAAGHKIA